MDTFKHLMFYDGECPLCSRAVRFVLSQDSEKQFAFAPLQGETAKNELADFQLEHPEFDTLVLLQDFGTEKEKIFIEGKAILRILWLLGGGYAFLGLLSFLPTFLFDFAYRIVAKNRYKIFKTKKDIDFSQGHFLP